MKLRLPLVVLLLLVPGAWLFAAQKGPGKKPAKTYVLLNKELFTELNDLRTNPAQFVAELEEYKTHFEGNEWRVSNELSIRTKEGVAAVDDAIKFLKGVSPKPAWRLSKGMSNAAADHAKYLGARGMVGHYGSDGSSPADRLSRYGTWKKTIGENISFGETVARRVVLQLLIDDGVPDRGHRKNLFKEEFTTIGIACGPHTVYTFMCVIDFAGDYREK